MNAVIRSMHSRIVDTDIGECDRVDERCGRWLATIVGVFVVEVEDILERGGRCCCTLCCSCCLGRTLALICSCKFRFWLRELPLHFILATNVSITSRR